MLLLMYTYVYSIWYGIYNERRASVYSYVRIKQQQEQSRHSCTLIERREEEVDLVDVCIIGRRMYFVTSFS